MNEAISEPANVGQVEKRASLEAVLSTKNPNLIN